MIPSAEYHFPKRNPQKLGPFHSRLPNEAITADPFQHFRRQPARRAPQCLTLQETPPLTPLASKALTVALPHAQVMSPACPSLMNQRVQEELRGVQEQLCTPPRVAALLLRPLR